MKKEGKKATIVPDGEYVVISKCEKRNMQMVVCNGKTMHIAIDPERPIIGKNHKYMQDKPVKKIVQKKEEPAVKVTESGVEIPEDLDKKIQVQLEKGLEEPKELKLKEEKE